MQKAHGKDERVGKARARLTQLRKRSAIPDQVGDVRDIGRQQATRCGRMCDEIAKIVRPKAGLAECGLHCPRRKLGIGIARTRRFMSVCKVSRDVASVNAESSRKNRSLPSHIDLKTRFQALEELGGGNRRTWQGSPHSQ